MARSKFPGKPSKPVNRTRINVLPSESEDVTNSDSNELKQGECDSGDDGLGITNVSCITSARHCQSRKTTRRKKVSKDLMVRKSLLTKRRHRNTSSGTTSTKLLSGANERSRRKVVSRSEKELVNTRKLNKVKRSRIETTNLVGTFVLPSRSVHSSRVIKPNKRFINVVEAVTSGQLRTFKKRMINKKSNSVKGDVDKVLYKPKSIFPLKDNECRGDSTKVLSQKIVDTSISRTPCSNRRIVLRQARLQLNTQSSMGPEGPFTSTNSSNNISPPGTVTCGVCGAVRFYRFVKQARKFNIYSCESCRKFISKMIKRQVCNKKLPDIQCLKGQGTCHVPPIVRSQHWKFRCAYKARCNACWLKMCLRSFQMPTSLKNSLINLLPDFMREPDSLFHNSLSLFSFHTNPNIDGNAASSNTNSLSSLKVDSKVETASINKRPVRKKVLKNNKASNSQPSTFEIKRQKIDLKGPRVKHVCRSASIVLGQPLALFPDDEKKQLEKPNSLPTTVDAKPDSFLSESIAMENKENTFTVDNTNSELIENSQDSDNQNILTKVVIAPIKREKDENNKRTGKLNKQYVKDPNNVCIDFWENYDPEEVCCNGFGLIASEPFSMLAVCFLCGSAGQEPFLFCSHCCEPYHIFCLEPVPKNLNTYERCYDWLCPRCTICNACGEADKQKINCQKCNKSYHPECFNTKWQTSDRPTVCSSCLRCKSCGTNNITKFVGNTPLCLTCFKLRKKGNFCPLCQKCYDDNDYNAKMMECGNCNKWVHAKCENLSEEQYQILSLLPEHIAYLCSLCESSPYWRKAVDTELRSNFNNVLRLLIKNCSARNILKWSPQRFSCLSNRVVTTARKLVFSDESDTFENSSEEETNDSNHDIRIMKEMQMKYKLKELRVTIKPCSIENNQMYLTPDKSSNTPSLASIKSKLNSNEYMSLREFNENMEETLSLAKSNELLDIYHSILRRVFPWYNPIKYKTADNLNESFCDSSYINLSSSEDAIKNILETYNQNMIPTIEKDTRHCALCKGIGDGLCNKEARLLYCGNNEWVHANCALWSSEVYEEIDGSLQNVHSAVNRGRLIRCTYCKQKGASIGCCAKNCHETYHFSCAHIAKCHFMHDKSIYCLSHDITNNSVVISSPSDFAIRRSVYVELDKKRKRYVDSTKACFMVGSLCVTNLGVFVPIISDNSEAIIPSDLLCKRLFWSTSEPWKLVSYIVTTQILTTQNNNRVADRNFTVDHMLPKLLIEKKLRDISIWQKELDKPNVGTELEDDEEPQNENATDILSPELTDAILEELPHELLDGISMQDIFPKLMTNEEVLGLDFKVSDISSTDYFKNDTVNLVNSELIKTTFFDDGKEICGSNKNSKDNKCDEYQSVPGINKIPKVRDHQCSCNVTLSCKVDNSLVDGPKQIKPVPQDKSVYLHLLQVDGAFDSSSDCESTTHEIGDLWMPDVLDEPVKCERCQCTYRTQASYKRHLENCEVISSSESDSEIVQDTENVELFPISNSEIQTETVPDVSKKTPDSELLVLASYETYNTYQTPQSEVHSSTLNTQTYVNTESTADPVPHNPDLFFSEFQPVSEQKTVPSLFTSQSINSSSDISIHQPSTSICEPSQLTISGTQTLSVHQHPSLSINQISTNQSNELCINQPSSLYVNQPNNSSMINQSGAISIISTPLPVSHNPISLNQGNTISLATCPGSLHINQPVEIQSQQLTIQSVPQELTPVLNITSSNPLSINAKMLAASNVVNPMLMQTITVPQNQLAKSLLKPAVVVQKSIKPKGRPRTFTAKRNRSLDSRTIFVPQNTTGGPSVVVQQVPSTNMIPTFLEAFQQQTGQNLQYITTITPQITSTVTNESQLIQLQPDGTLVNLVPDVQPTVILPQPRVLSDQIIVDNNGSLVWASHPVQPIFYGFETIVQNTVLQSQQFLPSAVPGVLTANSSYSSTTQVFQTSKLEPILDVTSGNIVLLNSNSVVNPQPIQVPQNVPAQLQAPASLIISDNKPSVSWNYIQQASNPIESQSKITSTQSFSNTVNDNCNSNSIINNSNNNCISISLPVAPFVPEPGIPTNVVPPTPKPVSVSSQSRPMNRVLPMPTINSKQNHKVSNKSVTSEKCITTHIYDKKQDVESSDLSNKSLKPSVLGTILEKPVKELILTEEKLKTNEPFCKEELSSIKLIFQKQREDGVYKVSNNMNSNIKQIASLKPLNTKNSVGLSKLTDLEPNVPDKTISIVPNNCKQNMKTDLKPALQEKQQPSMLYIVENADGFHYSSTSIADLWTKVFEAVQAARFAHNMPPLPSDSLNVMNDLHLLGLKSNGLKYLLEQLPGVGKCTKYKPIFHKHRPETDVEEDAAIEHVYGAVRHFPYTVSHEQSDMFGWLASKHRKPLTFVPNEVEQQISRRGSVNNLPMAMRFRHLKLTSKQSVGVYRSGIHKRGLFCHRDIESGEMVIEYAGEVIRSILADKREKQYTVKGMGCYMFRIDENFVVDATMKGNAARFINHSCEPNCYSKVVEILGHKHIIIFALRKILCGEELTYDYKFPFEEDKIPCTCGSRRCRKFLN